MKITKFFASVEKSSTTVRGTQHGGNIFDSSLLQIATQYPDFFIDLVGGELTKAGALGQAFIRLLIADSLNYDDVDVHDTTFEGNVELNIAVSSTVTLKTSSSEDIADYYFQTGEGSLIVVPIGGGILPLIPANAPKVPISGVGPDRGFTSNTLTGTADSEAKAASCPHSVIVPNSQFVGKQVASANARFILPPAGGYLIIYGGNALDAGLTPHADAQIIDFLAGTLQYEAGTPHGTSNFTMSQPFTYGSDYREVYADLFGQGGLPLDLHARMLEKNGNDLATFIGSV